MSEIVTTLKRIFKMRNNNKNTPKLRGLKYLKINKFKSVRMER